MSSSNFSRELKIQKLSGEIFSGQVYCERVDEIYCDWKMIFTSPVTEVIETIDDDLFQCLINIRHELARQSYRPLCNGARRNIVLSGMCSDMGEGGVGYLVKLGEPVNMEDLVDILDYAEPDLIASVEEQKEFSEKWLYPNGRNALITPLKKILEMQDENSNLAEGQLLVYRYSDPRKIEFIFSSPLLDFTCTGNSFFECLIDLRKKLEASGCLLLCNGSRPDVHVFNFYAKIIGGSEAYTLKYGEIPFHKDENTVSIFDRADSSLVGSIEEQERFFQNWLNSIELVTFAHEEYARNQFAELCFRLVSIGGMPRMWVFDIEDESLNDFRIALSLLSPDDVNQIGELKGEAVIGFFSDHLYHPSNFTVNKTFVDFAHKVIAFRAVEDTSLQRMAIEQQDGRINIVDKRATKKILSEDIIGSFEVKGGSIIPNSYRINENYAIFGTRGLFQLTPFLYASVLEALKAL